jgi:hypothetical protein
MSITIRGSGLILIGLAKARALPVEGARNVWHAPKQRLGMSAIPPLSGEKRTRMDTSGREVTARLFSALFSDNFANH